MPIIIVPKVSVIIPVYGVEKYIERCARSLFEQTLDDLEYIFVNDCTQDKSIDILLSVLNEYPHRKEQVRIINMDHNNGQAAVRKRGIEAANGEYVIHCDSDDFVDREMYRKMYESAKESNYDIIYCDYYEGNDGKWDWMSSRFSDHSDLICDTIMIGGALWKKMVKLSIVKDSSIIYPSSNFAEDLALSIQYAIRAKSCGYFPDAMYFYYTKNQSISRNYSKEAIWEKIRQNIENFNISVSALEKAGLDKRYKNEIIHYKLGIKNKVLQLIPPICYMKQWRQIYPEIKLSVFFCRYVTLREKMLFIISMFNIYPLIYRNRNNG